MEICSSGLDIMFWSAWYIYILQFQVQMAGIVAEDASLGSFYGDLTYNQHQTTTIWTTNNPAIEHITSTWTVYCPVSVALVTPMWIHPVTEQKVHLPENG